MGNFATDWRKRELLRIDEVCGLLLCSRSHVYDLLAGGHLIANHRNGLPGEKGMRIVQKSVAIYIECGQIDPITYTE